MNTAGNDLYTGGNRTGNKYSPSRVGTGRVDVPTAVQDSVLAYADDGTGSVGVSFGSLEVLSTMTLTKTVRVSNKSTNPASYTLSYDARSTVPGVSYSFPDGTAITVPAGGSTSVRVQLSADASLMRNTHDPTIDLVQGAPSNPRQWVSEASGLILLTQFRGLTLRVPVYATLRPASNMHAVDPAPFVNGDGTTTLQLAGQGINTGNNFPTDILSVATALELQGTSPTVTLGSDVSPAAVAADLHYIGVSSDVTGQIAASHPITNSTIYFGLSTYGNWTTPASEVEFDIYLDTNNDGTDDYVLYNTQTGPSTAPTDVFVTSLVNLTTQAAVTQGFVNVYNSNQPTAPFNSNVLVMPVKANALGMGAASRFSYHIETFHRSSSDAIDSAGPYSYDYAHPGLDFSGGATGVPLYADVPGAGIPLAYNQAAYIANNSQGALLLHHFNATGNRDQVVPISTTPWTATPTATTTSTPAATVTPCTVHFSDVTDNTTYYYQGVYYLACHGVISGYADGTYKPFNNTTRAQMTKIVTLAFNLPLVPPPAAGTFTDVDSSSVFYQLIETAASHGIVSGYTCGGVNPETGAAEPCTAGSRPYFRPNNNVTRGQLAKIVVISAGFQLLNPATATFTDVPTTNVFYPFIQTAVCHGVISGYADNTFRPNNSAFRGQIAKIVYLAVTNPATTCAP